VFHVRLRDPTLVSAWSHQYSVARASECCRGVRLCWGNERFAIQTRLPAWRGSLRPYDPSSARWHLCRALVRGASATLSRLLVWYYCQHAIVPEADVSVDAEVYDW
jgi:hypothetical protein